MKLLKISLLYLLQFIPCIVLYSQSDYILTTERLLSGEFNDRLATTNIKTFKFNRTYTAINFSFTFQWDITNNFIVHVQAYKFQSNEYREFPLQFERDVCDVLDKNEFGMRNIFICGNFPPCPIKKGNYTVCNWGPDYALFPPFIPHGQYRLNLKFYKRKEFAFELLWYIKIESSRLYGL